MKYYTGIGSRETPKPILEIMERMGQYLAEQGWTLRSGAAPGADTAFEKGCKSAKGDKEIYLPWASFGQRPLNKDGYFCMKIKDRAMSAKAGVIAAKHHPAAEYLTPAAMDLHTRNVFQVLGQDLTTPASFVVCYSGPAGGTQQARRIALANNIPIFNLIDGQDAILALKKFLEMPIGGWCPFTHATVVLV